jgi:hypothetical protein
MLIFRDDTQGAGQSKLENYYCCSLLLLSTLPSVIREADLFVHNVD